VLADLHQVKDPKAYGGGEEFWDGPLLSVFNASSLGPNAYLSLARGLRLLSCPSFARNHSPLYQPSSTARHSSTRHSSDSGQRGRRAGAHLVQVRCLSFLWCSAILTRLTFPPATSSSTEETFNTTTTSSGSPVRFSPPAPAPAPFASSPGSFRGGRLRDRTTLRIDGRVPKSARALRNRHER
jgi:hypothetical protein